MSEQRTRQGLRKGSSITAGHGIPLQMFSPSNLLQVNFLLTMLARPSLLFTHLIPGQTRQALQPKYITTPTMPNAQPQFETVLPATLWTASASIVALKCLKLTMLMIATTPIKKIPAAGGS
jgi:hypothetical protein